MRFLIVLAALAPLCASGVPLESTAGKLEFLAIGKPSAIKIKGEGPGPTGEFTLKKNGSTVQLSADLQIDLSAVQTGISLRDRHMKEKYLETDKFKTAQLVIKQAELAETALKGSGTHKVPGTLRIKGVEKPVDITVALQPAGDKTRSVSTFKINLTEYPIGVPSYAGITVANDVEVKVETQFATATLKDVK